MFVGALLKGLGKRSRPTRASRLLTRFVQTAGFVQCIAILNQLQKSWASLILINLVLIQSFYKKTHTSLAWKNQNFDNELQA